MKIVTSARPRQKSISLGGRIRASFAESAPACRFGATKVSPTHPRPEAASRRAAGSGRYPRRRDPARRGARRHHAPHGGTRRLEGRHPLREKTGDHAGQDVAGAGGGKPGRQVAGNRGAAVRCGHDGIGPFEEDDGAHDRRGGTRAVELRGAAAPGQPLHPVEEPLELAVMRGQHDAAAPRLDRRGEARRGATETRERIGIEDGATRRAGQDRKGQTAASAHRRRGPAP